MLVQCIFKRAGVIFESNKSSVFFFSKISGKQPYFKKKNAHLFRTFRMGEGEKTRKCMVQNYLRVGCTIGLTRTHTRYSRYIEKPQRRIPDLKFSEVRKPSPFE